MDAVRRGRRHTLFRQLKGRTDTTRVDCPTGESFKGSKATDGRPLTAFWKSEMVTW